MSLDSVFPSVKRGTWGKSLRIIERGPVDLPHLQWSLPPSHFSLCVSHFSLCLCPSPQTSQLLRPWPGLGPAASEGCSVQDHRVSVPTVPGLEHCLFVPVALTSWPAGRLTLAGPAASRNRLSEKVLPPTHPGPQFPQMLFPRRDHYPVFCPPGF